MITRRAVSLAGGFGLILASTLSRGQAGKALRRVGVLTASSETLAAPFLAALKQGMTEFGWQEGKDIEYRFAYANGISDRYAALVAELMAQKVDVLVVTNTTSTRAAQRATQSLPIVMTSGSGVVGAGIVQSLARPAGNVTGLSIQSRTCRPRSSRPCTRSRPELGASLF